MGPNYINPLNQTWLYNGDLSIYQLGWKFFRADVWQFPLGKNPNYGIYFGGSVVFSDSIPILAFIFKIFKNFIPNTFQYFSFWILICIYLQIYLAYKIIFYYSQNSFYSFISSLFFIISTIFIHRSGIHLSLMGHWLILLYFFISISEKLDNKENKKKYLILFSCLIHLYFTIILIIIYLIETLLKLKLNLKYIIKTLLYNSVFFISLILLMYVTGYFSIKLDDGLGGGYGYYNFNLNSFFNPYGSNNLSSFSWSFFLKNFQFYNSKMEGFSYLGISGFVFLILYLLNVIKGKYEIIYKTKISVIIVITLILLAASNNISFGEYNLINIQLNKYIYLFLSSIRASGRLIWPVYYLILFSGIIYIYLSQSKKNANIIISILFILQLIDLTPGLSNYTFGKQYEEQKEQFVKSKSWSGLSNNFSEIRLLNPKNQSELFYNLVKHIMSENYHKTDVSYLARVNRQSLEDIRQNHINKFNARDLEIFNNRVYVTKNISLVKNLKVLYGNKLKVYYLDNIWLISNQEINNLSKYDYQNTLLEYFKLSQNKKIFKYSKEEKNNPFGFGWEYDEEKKKFVSVGYISTLIFELDNGFCNKNINISFNIDQYFKNYYNLGKIKIVLNDNINKSISFEDKSQLNIKFLNNCIENNLLKVDFYYTSPISKYEIRSGLNRKKRAIILNSVHIK